MNWFDREFSVPCIQGMYEERVLFRLGWLGLECRVTRLSAYSEMFPRIEASSSGHSLHEIRVPVLGAMQHLVCIRGNNHTVTYRTKLFRPDLDVHFTANCSDHFAYFISLRWRKKLSHAHPSPVNSSLVPEVLASEIHARKRKAHRKIIGANADYIANWPFSLNDVQEYVVVGDYVYAAAFAYQPVPSTHWPNTWPAHHQVRYARKYLIERT